MRLLVLARGPIDFAVTRAFSWLVRGWSWVSGRPGSDLARLLYRAGALITAATVVVRVAHHPDFIGLINAVLMPPIALVLEWRNLHRLADAVDRIDLEAATLPPIRLLISVVNMRRIWGVMFVVVAPTLLLGLGSDFFWVGIGLMVAGQYCVTCITEPGQSAWSRARGWARRQAWLRMPTPIPAPA